MATIFESGTAKQTRQWKYLVPYPGKKDLYLKGRKLPAFSVWNSIGTEGYTVEEAADDWNLSVEAVQEAVTYCEENQSLLEQLAEEQWRFAQANGAKFGL